MSIYRQNWSKIMLWNYRKGTPSFFISQHFPLNTQMKFNKMIFPVKKMVEICLLYCSGINAKLAVNNDKFRYKIFNLSMM